MVTFLHWSPFNAWPNVMPVCVAVLWWAQAHRSFLGQAVASLSHDFTKRPYNTHPWCQPNTLDNYVLFRQIFNGTGTVNNGLVDVMLDLHTTTNVLSSSLLQLKLHWDWDEDE